MYAKLGEKLADKAAAADAHDDDSAKRKAVDSPATGKAGKRRAIQSREYYRSTDGRR